MSTEITIRWNERKAIQWALDEDGMTAAELADKIEMDPGKLSRIIHNKQKNLPVHELKRIAEGQGRPLPYYTETPLVHVMSSCVIPLFPALNPTVRAHETTDRVVRPIDFYAQIPDAA